MLIGLTVCVRACMRACVRTCVRADAIVNNLAFCQSSSPVAEKRLCVVISTH